MIKMLTELCGYLKNWFEVEQLYGDFVINAGTITFADGTALPLQEGQHFRIIGSIFNDGVYEFLPIASEGSSQDPSEVLKNEAFNGSVWTLAIPREVLALADEISAWRSKYEGADSAALSPFTSESFGGYSYSKSGGNSADGNNGNSWQSVFGNRLIRYRKI